MRKPLTFFTLSLLGALLAPPGYAATFQIAQDEHSLNEVSFTSVAPLVRMVGRTREVIGKADIDPAKPNAATGRFVVDLSKLDTGIKLRNGHLQNTIEGEKYPVAVLQIDKVDAEAPELKLNQTVGVKATGTFTLHGVTRPVTVPGEITLLGTVEGTRDGDWVRLEARFPIVLSDYGIPVPKSLLGVKVSDRVAIDVTAMAKASGSALSKTPAKTSSAK